MQASSAQMQQKYAKVKSVLCQNATGIGLKCASMPQIVPLFLQKCYLKAETQMGHFCTKLPPQTCQQKQSSNEQQFWWVLLNLTEVSFSYDMLWYSFDSFSDLQKYPDISRFCCIASWIWVDSLSTAVRVHLQREGFRTWIRGIRPSRRSPVLPWESLGPRAMSTRPRCLQTLPSNGIQTSTN